MKKLQFFLVIFCAVSLTSHAQVSNNKMNDFINALMKKMTLDEKIGQLNLVTPGGTVTGAVVSKDVDTKIRNGQVGGLFGITGPDKIRRAQEIAVKNSRLHIPLIFGLDVIHGHRTIFPIPLGLASSWDTAMIRQSARIAANEATADGLNWVFSPMVDIARDPRWGRIAEGNGEDPFLGSQIAKAMVEGYQGNDLSKDSTVMACVKHYALYGAAEAGRDYNTVDMSKVKMYNEYLPPYKAAVDAGVGSVMTSFNTVNGVPATANKFLLTDVLRNQWGFKGLVVTDYTSINEMVNHGIGNLQTVSARALNAGVDMDMVGEGFLTTLKKSLREGKVTEKTIDDA
jgi:beta-glucosidase